MKNTSNLEPEVVYNAEERLKILRDMRDVADNFYAGAIATKNHPFIEFCGLMGEYHTICVQANNKGIDFTNANQHSGQALPMYTFNANYIGEKMGCIFGPSFRDKEIFTAFVEALELPYNVYLYEGSPISVRIAAGEVVLKTLIEEKADPAYIEGFRAALKLIQGK